MCGGGRGGRGGGGGGGEKGEEGCSFSLQWVRDIKILYPKFEQVNLTTCT